VNKQKKKIDKIRRKKEKKEETINSIYSLFPPNKIKEKKIYGFQNNIFSR
jgi:hypothetical protein